MVKCHYRGILAWSGVGRPAGVRATGQRLARSRALVGRLWRPTARILGGPERMSRTANIRSERETYKYDNGRCTESLAGKRRRVNGRYKTTHGRSVGSFLRNRRKTNVRAAARALDSHVYARVEKRTRARNVEKERKKGRETVREREGERKVRDPNDFATPLHSRTTTLTLARRKTVCVCARAGAETENPANDRTRARAILRAHTSDITCARGGYNKRRWKEQKKTGEKRGRAGVGTGGGGVVARVARARARAMMLWRLDAVGCAGEEWIASGPRPLRVFPTGVRSSRVYRLRAYSAPRPFAFPISLSNFQRLGRILSLFSVSRNEFIALDDNYLDDTRVFGVRTPTMIRTGHSCCIHLLHGGGRSVFFFFKSEKA